MVGYGGPDPCRSEGDDTRKVLSAYTNPLKNCREGEVGDLNVVFTINEDGSVSDVSASGPLVGTPVEVCAVEKFKVMRFKKSLKALRVRHVLP